MGVERSRIVVVNTALSLQYELNSESNSRDRVTHTTKNVVDWYVIMTSV